MNYQASHTATPRSFGMMVPPDAPSSTGRVVLRHLQTAREIESVLELRAEIDLSVHASVSSNFASLEKKETNWGSCSLSSSTGTS